MIGLLILALILPIYLFYVYSKAFDRPCDNFPPGPPKLPVYGSYWIVLSNELNNLSAAFTKLGEKYKTKVVGFYHGPIPSVTVNDATLIRETLFCEDCDGRMDIILGRLRSFWKKLGIFFTDGYFWKVQRRFSLRYMRDFGFGRRDQVLESIITAETKEMVDIRINGPKNAAEEEIVKGELVYLPHFFDVPFLNGIVYVLAQSTLPRSEYHRLWKMSKGGLKFQRNSDDMGRALSLTPWLKDLFPKWSGFKGLREGNQVFLDFYNDLVQEIMLTQDESHDRNFLDMYIRTMKKEMEENGRSTFSVDQLLLVCTDYTFPTATAVEMTLTMLVERILYQPGLQERIHEEIDRVIGRNRLPTIEDRNNMPFVEGCLREIMRMESIVPLGLPHRSLKNVKIGGYDVPENSMICLNYFHLHMDKDLWGDPENFRPDRYIVDGKLSVAQDKSLPFGAGKRLCAGETYARNSMFLVFATFMQAFHVSTSDGKPLKKLAPRIPGIITTLPEFWIRVTPRKEISN